MKKWLYYKRTFLNRKSYHAGAFILAKILKETYTHTHKKTKKKVNEVSYEVNLDIADCSRIISLDIDLYSKREAANSLRKLDILISTLVEFRKIFVKEIPNIKS
ncbi:MAG TPA: hypothetical protein ENI61_04320 [Ignavibacteria bacterium]|nr:hypothetical protein [Ignavibacteria bacterium]